MSLIYTVKFSDAFISFCLVIFSLCETIIVRVKKNTDCIYI